MYETVVSDHPSSDTARALLAAALELFAAHGYRGASVRAITRRAGANLGAVTYHFGSKEALYGTVLASVAQPFRHHLLATAARPGTALDRIERMVRAFFDYLRDHPELPGLMVQHLAGSDPFPDAARRVLEGNHRVISTIIAEGQEDGSIRAGDPRLMALSIVAQPVWLALVTRLLQEALGLDQHDPETRTALVGSVVRFVRAGLAAHPEQAS
jgi:AcrR family transcriptional regulator